MGIIALRLAPDHTVLQKASFGIDTADQGTGIKVWKGYLYAASGTQVQRFALDDMLVPTKSEVIVDGITPSNHPIAFDGKGSLFVSIDGGGGTNNCPDPKNPKEAKPVGLKPCPLLDYRGGIWRFDENKTGPEAGRRRAFRHRHPQFQRAGLARWRRPLSDQSRPRRHLQGLAGNHQPGR